ncbi:hypothetical protein LYY04_12025 [Lactococcus lactis]|uniref:hypothetical protein n=1 Tax=Lactococcus lactis TaxID=1358 RepID=UPI001F0E0936|nr:hypothetical protein [Lactococcus lactis]MCH5428460.1 hypothetical protein [Lactococcus lactis]MCT0085361.1 hypothetical protein [Lactococcus lactis subsp. lactis]
MKEQLKFGEQFVLVFDEMSIQIIGPEDILKINVFIDIDIKEKDVLDPEVFEPQKDYKLHIKFDIKEQLGQLQSSLASTHKAIGEAKKLLDFIYLNEKNFLEKVVPELRVKVDENFSD